MSKKVTKNQYVSYSIDKATKQEAEKIIRKLGFTPTSVINLFYENIIENKKVPFDIQHNKKKSVGFMCRIDKKKKESAEKIIRKLGITPTCLFNMLYNEIIKHHGLPFEVKMRLNEEEK